MLLLSSLEQNLPLTISKHMFSIHAESHEARRAIAPCPQVSQGPAGMLWSPLSLQPLTLPALPLWAPPAGSPLLGDRCHILGLGSAVLCSSTEPLLVFLKAPCFPEGLGYKPRLIEDSPWGSEPTPGPWLRAQGSSFPVCQFPAPSRYLMPKAKHVRT